MKVYYLDSLKGGPYFSKICFLKPVCRAKIRPIGKGLRRGRPIGLGAMAPALQFFLGGDRRIGTMGWLVQPKRRISLWEF